MIRFRSFFFHQDYKEKQREKFKHLAVYPCKLKILPEHIFNTRDPIVIGVNIEAGTLRMGTPIVVPAKEVEQISTQTDIKLQLIFVTIICAMLTK